MSEVSGRSTRKSSQAKVGPVQAKDWGRQIKGPWSVGSGSQAGRAGRTERTGRAGRAGRTGRSLSSLSPEQLAGQAVSSHQGEKIQKAVLSTALLLVLPNLPARYL